MEKKPSASSPAPKDKKVIKSETLFEGRKEVTVLHGDQEYRLMITRAGKLILNK